MNKILFLKGLPASGKSTYALELIHRTDMQWIRVNKDDIREANPKWNEGTVIKHETEQVRKYLQAGLNVVIDNTHFNPIHEERYRNIANEFDADFEVKYFDVDPLTCIERDSLRPAEKRVGAKVIREMYNTYIYKSPKGFRKTGKIILCDIDGTVSSKCNRDIFDYSKVINDYPNEILFYILKLLNDKGYNIVFLSGREDSCKDETSEWISKYFHNQFTLLMRQSGDKRDDTIVKAEIFDAHFKPKDIFCVFDDRPKVVTMWKQKGLYVFGCNQEPYNLPF